MPGHVVPHRLGHSEVEQPDAHSCGEQHREIRGVAVFLLVVGFSEFDLGILWEVEDDDEHRPGILRADIQPRPSLRDPQYPERELCLGRLRLDNAPDNEAPDDERGQHGDHRIQVVTDRPNAAFHPPPRLSFIHLHLDNIPWDIIYICGQAFLPNSL